MTGIDYLDETWSPITGCSGKGCKAHCWAREMVRRFPQIHGHSACEAPYGGLEVDVIPFSVVQFHPDRLDKPLHWRKPRRVGVCFMGDMFDEQMICGIVEWEKVFTVYDVMFHKARQHVYFILTKQPRNMVEFYSEWIRPTDNLDNVWHGVSICDQEDADRMIPELLKVPGKKWVSYEPAIGPVKFKEEWFKGISWIVMGCESGPGHRRLCPHEWMIDVVKQCKEASVPVYCKQVDMGKRVSHNWVEWPDGLRVREKGVA